MFLSIKNKESDMVEYKFMILLLLQVVTPSFMTGQVTNSNVKQALVIVDIQNDYFEEGTNYLAGSWDASLKAKKMLEFFRIKSLPIIHVQHLSVRHGSTFFIPNTKGADIHANVLPDNGEKVIVKNYPNSFRDTELLDYLKANNITDLVICGMMTHMCVDATARAAKDYGYNCTIISEACATKDLELNGCTVKAKDVQIAFLSALSYYYCRVMTINDYLAENK